MKSIEAVKLLHKWDKKRRCLFRSRELGLIFNEQGNTLRSTLRRLVEDGVLVKVAHDAYLYAFNHLDRSLIGEIAVFLRPGEFTYESLESAASQWGVISQVPLGRVTCVTTGRAGEVPTPYGVIDYEHTDDFLPDLGRSVVDRTEFNALPIATKQRAVADLVAHDRSTDLIDWEEVDDEG
ncbi:type IV toxin-antitoxin system AbiEi family antitoxin [Rubneribacter sp.]